METTKLSNPRASGAAFILWLGQAGFLLQLPSGRRVLIDPYLTDSIFLRTCQTEGFSFKRLCPAPFSAEELEPDEVFCSHEHGDHLDIGCIAALLRNPRTRLLTNPASAKKALELGVRQEQICVLGQNSSIDLGEYRVDVLPAQHGALSPEAMGFLFHVDGYRIYYAGDTAFDRVLLQNLEGLCPELALLPINGAYGNMDAKEAAEYAAFCGAKRCVPCHFWMFAKHGGDPLAFSRELAACAPDCELIMLTPGETYRLTP